MFADRAVEYMTPVYEGIWSGTISFGLVSVPVRMFSATESRSSVSTSSTAMTWNRSGTKRCARTRGTPCHPTTSSAASRSRRAATSPIEDEDLDRLDIELTHSIDICDFVSLDEIDLIYFRKAYYLLPQDGAEKPYRLLVRALDETGKVGIAKVVIRNKQHLAALRALDDVLVIETMYYPDEIRQPESVDSKTRLQKAEVDMAKSLVENLSDSFKPERYDDTYRKELLQLIRAKAKGKKLPEPKEEEEAEVVDLMAALRESVEHTKKKPTRKRAKKAS